MKRSLPVLFIFQLIGLIAFAQPQMVSDTAFTTVKNGNWSDPLVWKGLRIPDYRDSVVLQHDVVVDTDANCRALNINGKGFTINPGIKFNIEGTPIEISPSARVIDSTKLKLISSTFEKEKGWFVYQKVQPVPIPEPGNVIIDNSDDGYLRKVDSMVQTAETVTLFTSQADMEDVFTNAKFGFNLPLSGLQEEGNPIPGQTSSPETVLHSPDAFTFSVDPGNLYTNGPLSVDLANASISLQPDMRLDFDYGLGGLKKLNFECKEAKLTGNLALQIKATGKSSGSRTDTLKRYGMTRIVLVGNVPVHMKIDFFLISTISFSAEAQVSRTFNFNLDETFFMQTKYDRDGGWVNQFENTESKSNIDLGIFSGSAKVDVGIDIKPLIKVRFYSIVAPYAFMDMRMKFTGRATSPALYWDFHAKGWVEPGLGLEVKIFGKKPAIDFGPKRWVSDSIYYRTPFKLQKVDGDLQVSDDTVNTLPKPIKVKVIDELDFPQSNVVVKFKITSGKGSISDTTALTDVNGVAEINWRIGSETEQTLEVTAYRGDSSEIAGSPLLFTAIFGEKEALKVVKTFNMANTGVFTTNFFKSLGVGKGGYIYAGTANNGLYKYTDSTWSKLSVLTNNNISDFQTDNNGGVWIAQYGHTGAQATTGGINYFPDSSNSGFTYYGATLGAPTRNARGIFIDTTRTNGGGRPRLWSAHMGHLTAGVPTTGAIGLGLNENNPFFTKITAGIETAMDLGSIQCIGGNAEEIWAFASVNFGKSQIVRYNAATGSFLGAYDYLNTAVAGFTSNFSARAIYFDLFNSKWIGLFSGGLVVKEGDSWINVNMPEILPAGTVISTNGISGGKFGKVFIATSTGLLIYSGGEKTDPASYKRVTASDGLPSNNVLDVIERRMDNILVVATDSGIAFIKGY